MFKLRQQPGSGPPAMQVVPVGHYFEFQSILILSTSVSGRGILRIFLLMDRMASRQGS